MLLGVVDRLNLSPDQKQMIRTLAEQQLQGSAPGAQPQQAGGTSGQSQE